MDNFERRLAASMRIAAAQGPDVEPESSRSNKRRAGLLALAASVVVGSVIAATFVVGTSGIGILDQNKGSDKLTPGTATEGDFAIPTYVVRPGTVTNAIGFRGTLQFSPDGCPRLGEPGGMPLAFPQGFVGRIDADGARAILDDKGSVWATEGDALTIGPGGSGQEQVRDSQGCTSGARSEVNPLLVSSRMTSSGSPTGADDRGRVLDRLSFTLLLGTRHGDRLPSRIRVENNSGRTVTDPGCRVNANYSWGVVPVAQPDKDLFRHVMTRCLGSHDLPDGFANTFEGPTFSLTEGPTSALRSLGPGEYLATIDFGDARSQRLTAKITIDAP